MTEFRADLHCHSTFSDGLLTPIELLQLAKLMGLTGLSITDHDTITAYSQEVFEEARRLQIILLPGVEVSSQCMQHTVHILGYGFDLAFAGLHQILEEIQRRRIKRNREILKRLQEEGMKITEEELMEFANRTNSKTIGRPHIARLMLEKGYVSSFQQAFNIYLKDGGKCYVPAEKFSCPEVIDVIHQARGKAILAHPHLIEKQSILSEICQFPFDGVEGYYSSFRLSQKRKWSDIAEEKNWIITAGSDFHGKEEGELLGSSWVGKEIFDQLVSMFKE